MHKKEVAVQWTLVYRVDYVPKRTRDGRNPWSISFISYSCCPIQSWTIERNRGSNPVFRPKRLFKKKNNNIFLQIAMKCCKILILTINTRLNTLWLGCVSQILWLCLFVPTVATFYATEKSSFSSLCHLPPSLWAEPKNRWFRHGALQPQNFYLPSACPGVELFLRQFGKPYRDEARRLLIGLQSGCRTRCTVEEKHLKPALKSSAKPQKVKRVTARVHCSGPSPGGWSVEGSRWRFNCCSRYIFSSKSTIEMNCTRNKWQFRQFRCCCCFVFFLDQSLFRTHTTMRRFPPHTPQGRPGRITGANTVCDINIDHNLVRFN